MMLDAPSYDMSDGEEELSLTESNRDSIMDYCWQSDNFIDDNTLAVNMTRLRKKLSEIGFDDLIQTKKGVGYYLKEGK